MAGWTCSDSQTIEWDGILKARKKVISPNSPTDNIDCTNKAYVDGKRFLPVGAIYMYGGSSNPSGGLICDGGSYPRATYPILFNIIGTTFGATDGSHFNIPDFRGIFPRGAGTSGKLTNANGTAFSGTLGTYQNDKMQGHYHTLTYDNFGAGGADAYGTKNAAPNANTRVDRITTAVSDSVNGTPRTGTETNPANLGINFVIVHD